MTDKKGPDYRQNVLLAAAGIKTRLEEDPQSSQPRIPTSKKQYAVAHHSVETIGGAVPPPSSAPSFTPQPPPQANPPVPTPQPYGVMPGMPGSPYVIPGQTQIYPQGPPPTYDQALTHPAAIVGQHMYPPGTMYAAGYPTYLGYPTYTPMQYYPSLGAYSYAMQPAQLRPTIMIPNPHLFQNGYDAGARFDGITQQVIPPTPPGVPPSAAQLAAMAGHQVALGQKKNTFLAGGSEGGYAFW